MYDSLTLDDCFDPEFWPKLTGFALVAPDEDILPVRAAYNGRTWGIGVNPVTSDGPLWYSLADCAASALLTGHGINALRVVMLNPEPGSVPLKSVRLRGTVELDPMVRDPMLTIVEERQRVKRDDSLSEIGKKRLSAALKVVGNAGSYGIYSEFNARTPRSYEQVEAIQARFNALNPYDSCLVPNLLKLEAEGLCYAISAKRYAIYTLDQSREPIFDRDHPPSEHGLGHFLNLTEDRIKDLWRIILRRAHLESETEPPWLSEPTMVRTTVTSPSVRHGFRRLNEGKPYEEQIKPFNFLLTAAGARPPAGHPKGKPFRLIAPYESDPTKWETMEWTDVHNPEAGTYSITTRDGRPGMARVDTFGDVLAKYETHPESKSLGPDGEPCGRGTIGLLQRRPVTVGKIVLIGKESNRIEERSSGELTVDDLDELVTTYQDHDEWYRVTLPRLRKLGVKAVVAQVGISERRARDVLQGRALPHTRHRRLLMELIGRQ
jgi:hypothetical protein